MSRALLIFCFLCLALRAFATDPLTISNNAYIGFQGDSLWRDDQDGKGYRVPSMWWAGEALLHPLRTNFVTNPSRSGGSMDDRATNTFPATIGFYGYRSNANQHIVFSTGTDAGSSSSNVMFLAHSNLFQAPAKMSDGSYPLTVQTGWAATAVFQWIAVGDPPPNASDGSPATEGARSGATKAAGTAFGFLGIDTWLNRILAWTNDIVNSNAVNIGYTGDGHIIGGGDYDWYDDLRMSTTPSDTNVPQSMVDYADASVVSTNLCVVSGLSKTNGTLSFTRREDCLPPAYFVPSPDGTTLTNDSRPGFNLNAASANRYRFTLGVTNLPAAFYDIYANGTWIAKEDRATLAAGWNMFTNNVGPIWAHRQEVLLRVLDAFNVDHKTLLPRGAGLGQGDESLISNEGAQWALNKRGDALIAAIDFKMTQMQTNYAAIYQAAQPSNTTFLFVPAATAAITTLNVGTLTLQP